MIRITRSFEWDMGHRVTNHNSLCRNPHGHRYKMLVEISGDLDIKSGSSSQGMVLDFGDFKRLVEQDIIDKYDHSFMYWEQDEVLSDFAGINQDLNLISVPFVPTVECIVQDIAKRLQMSLRQQLRGVCLDSVILYETPKCSAKWIPS